MTPGNLGQIRNKVSYLVNFNPGQTDQDFRGPAAYANQRVHDAINEAYTEEVNLGKTASRDWFRRRVAMTWTADAATMAIPLTVKDADIEIVLNETSTTPGVPVPIWNLITDGSGLYRYDMDTWGWYPTPSAAQTIAIYYVGRPVELNQDDDEPSLIPMDHRDLLVWSAGIILKTIADEEAPQKWIKRQEALRFNFHKTLSMGHPHQYPPPRIRHQYADITRSF